MNHLAKRSSTDLSKYNPDKGLKTIAVAEAAEKHFAKAKDATGLERAIRAKREALAEFVFWWDTKGPGTNHGGKRGNGKISDQKSWPVDSLTVHRWRKKLNDPAAFESTLAQAIARCTKIVDFETAAHVGHNSGENEWYTPAEYIEAARVVLGDIDLDPASNDTANAVVKAGQIFTPDDNALEQQWDGRVWMNPPYSQPLISQFCEKLAGSVQVGTVTAAVVLVNNATETQWFRSLIDVSAALCFPSGRVRFWSPNKDSATPLQGQAVIYAGSDFEKFCDVFKALGFTAVIRK